VLPRFTLTLIPRTQLGWQPKQPGLIADLDGPRYFEA
jgi:hypothetical protein